MDTHDPPQSRPAAAVEAGLEALGRGAWEEARSAFERSLRADESPEALEGLGMAAWWLEDDGTVIDARRRAFRLYQDRGDRRGAARVVATGLALDHYFRGEHAVANGWIRRAHRLLEGIEQCPELGWLAIFEAHMALRVDHDPATAQELSAQAVALGRSLGNIDLEMLALAYEGCALVDQGKIAEGMHCLDEAAAAAVAGEMSHLYAISMTYCCLIYSCERVRDFHRVAQWCAKLKELCERWSYRMKLSICRTYYASTLIWRGAWTEAEVELEEATGALERTRPAQAADGLVRLAELRRRQGRFEEVALLLEKAASHPFRMLAGHLAILGRAAMALDRGDAATAADLAERFLRAITKEDRLERAVGLEVLLRARLALGAHAEAEKALDELRSIASIVDTEAMRGSGLFADGLVAAAARDYKAAKGYFEDAVYLFGRSDAPFETASARLELARCLFALGQSEAAELQAQDARESFEILGAAAEAERAAALLRELERVSETPDLAGLSRREVEVLRLVAQGLSNQEIAAHLVLSRHTVHRHVSSILAKLALPSRAAAAAYAAQKGLL
jgi:LuxR family transcriptional regulator, maltose regulon positive regulatory protein